ncbi:TRAP transporter small permease [Marinobacter sp. JSM 1782161]|uniref:TRAP transporter small permease n=1 Tax=Marinobacter sp. JSM 1782161 TaxID=2685906 RepID=UPI001402A72C|nr:TRAP transporter small permease [Marinobacter sp. JSM 1782161]
MNTFEVSPVNVDAQAVAGRNRSGAVRALIRKAAGLINLSGAAVVVVTLVTMFAAILLNVILRYFFDSGITWAYEIPAILFPWCVAGGVVMSAAQGRHIAVDVIIGLLPAPLRRVLAIAINVFVSLVSAGVVYYSMPIIKASQFSRLAETGIPQIYGYASLVYAFSMVAVIGLLTAIDYLSGRRVDADDPTATNYS